MRWEHSVETDPCWRASSATNETMKNTTKNPALSALQNHVTGAIERGKTTPTIEQPATMANAIRNGLVHLESIKELVTRLQSDDDDIREAAKDEAYSYPLSVQVRTGWFTPCREEDASKEEFRILLSTGGPACRIFGELDHHCEPSRARLEVKDWLTPWEEVGLLEEESESLLSFCQAFYFGE